MGRRCLRATVWLALLMAAGCAQTPPPASPALSASVAMPPPAPPIPSSDVVPPPPGPEYVWVPGQWAWRAVYGRYLWIPGHYRVPRDPNNVWVPGHWIEEPRGYSWIEGHWRVP